MVPVTPAKREFNFPPPSGQKEKPFLYLYTRTPLYVCDASRDFRDHMENMAI